MSEQRQIRFRVWDSKEKKWLHGPGEEVNLFGEVIIFGELIKGMSLDRLNDLVPLQFTGLLDRNGKEQYHHDIVRRSGYAKFDPRKIAVIRWNVLTHGWVTESLPCTIGDKTFGPAAHPISKDDEVIGNIHEHPELLKDSPNGR